MPAAIDGARGVIQPVVEANAVEVGEAPVVGEAHVPFLAADGGFTAHQTVSLPGPERAIAQTHGNPLVLEGAPLIDVCAAMLELVLVLRDSGPCMRAGACCGAA